MAITFELRWSFVSLVLCLGNLPWLGTTNAQGDIIMIENFPSNFGVLIGQPVAFNCTVDHSNSSTVNITWKVNGINVPTANINTSTDDTMSTTTSTVRFDSVMDSQAGDYNCNVTDGNTTDSDTFRLSVITIQGVNNVITSAGNTAMFFCSATGDPNLNYNWSLTNMTALPSDRSTMSGANLTIQTVTYLDSRNNSEMVECQISLFGRVIGTATGRFEVLRAVVVGNPMSQTIDEGETAVFNCTAENSEGAPNQLTFQWGVNNSLPLMVDSNRITISNTSEGNGSNTTTSSLTIRDTTFNDFGSYFCVVTNFRPVDAVESTRADLTIQFVPAITRIDVEVNGVFLPENSQPFMIDANVSTNILVGYVFSVPEIDLVRLLRNGEDTNIVCSINSSSNTFRCPLPELSVSESITAFEVLVANALGNDTETFTVWVQAVPGPVNVSMVTSEVLDLLRVRLQWSMPESNNAVITRYLISFCLLPTSGSCTPDRNMTTSDSSLTFDLQHGADLNSNLSVTIAAENRVGRGPISEEVVVPVATTVDATPQNIRTSAATDTFMIIVWDLPSTAEGDGIDVSYAVDLNFSSSDSFFNLSSTNQGVLLNNTFGIAPDVTFEVVVTAEYTNPAGVEATTLPMMFTVPQASAVQPILPNGRIMISNNNPTTQAVINWPSPNNTEFLQNYLITVTNSLLNPVSLRRKRATQSSTLSRNIGTTSAIIDTCAYSTVAVEILAVYTDSLMTPLLPKLNFTTGETAPSAPRDLRVELEGIRNLKCTWQVPDPTNGVIRDYKVQAVTQGSSREENSGGTDTTLTFTDLLPNMNYTVSVTAETVEEGPPSSVQIIRTGFGVNRPTVTVQTIASANDIFSARFTVERSDGPISFYQVIVSRGMIDNSITMTNLQPYSSDSRSLYIAAVGILSEQQNSETVFIGGGAVTMNGSIEYTNQNLSGNTDYYVFIRVFSSINVSVFNDSALSQPIRYSPGLNVAAVIGSIGAVAGILIIVLVVLLIFAYITMASPFKRTEKGALVGDGPRRNRNQGSVEMRRTRLFCPVINVGESDVFTSAGQPTTLICEASGTPAPSVSWTRFGEPLDKERFIQLADGSLFINDTDLQDEGTYTVTAVNSVGDEEVSIHLNILKPVPPEDDEDRPPIKVGEFSEKIALLRADEGLEDEYEEVEPDINVTSYTSKININKNKNRYINIIPYDHSRVVLSLQDNTPGSDYINASFIDAYQAPNGYIASQGPMPSTFPDFWRMIWELDVPTIVMVTNLTEDDKVKCHQYWPSYGTKTYGNVQVTLKEVENLAEYCIRTFNISPLAGQSRHQMPVREVRQFQFLVWPDHGVPTYATNLLSFRKRVLKYHPEKRGPMVVHCSAGVGRTGTFITIDYMLKQIEAESSIDIYNFVRQMRYRRNYMVQTASQYVFIHDALLESIMCGDNSIKAPELKKKVKELKEVAPDTGLSMFETVFKTLEAASPPDEDFDCSIAQMPENVSKNRSKSHLPANDFRVVLSTDNGQSDYICASFIDNYRERNAFIVTQAPLAETVNDFWRMIRETKSAAIVMLTELEEDGQEMCVKYWPSTKEQPAEYGKYKVSLNEEKNKGDYITRKFTISSVESPEESHVVSQFHFIRWSKTQPPKDSRPMIDLIDELQRAQRKSGNMPITVHCDDGIGRTGAFCTLYSVLERVKTEQVVDVFQAVKTLRIQRTGLLTTVSEYEFVHYAVIEFLETFSEYSNFK